MARLISLRPPPCCTNLGAQATSAWSPICWSKPDRTMTRVPGAAASTCGNASSPSISGMRRSSRTSPFADYLPDASPSSPARGQGG